MPSLSRALTLGLASRGGGLPPLPSGFAFLVDESGAYLIDENGDYLIAEEV